MKKSEQKEHLIDMMRGDENLKLYENWVEDAEKEFNLSDLNSKANIFWSGYSVGVKSKERMYSEADMAESFMACWKANVSDGIECKLSFKEWFEEFKKK
jgi:hypothetical protein